MLGAGVWWALIGRHVSVNADVEELSTHVERLAKQWRSIQMRAVRAAAEDRHSSDLADITPPPELQPAPQTVESKEALRARAFGRR